MHPSTLTGDVVGRFSPAYETARMDFNRRLSLFPRYVVFCEAVRDVQNAVRWSRAHGVPLRARGGRHSYEDYSVLNGGLVIDVSRLNTVELDREAGVARIGAGARLGQVYDALWAQGMVTIPGGGCTGVGVSGLTLGGGFGLLTRLWGLTCDSLRALQMVDANGEVVNADDATHPDLMWASRGGGGGNFGVTTAFTFRVFPIDFVTVFNITWAWSDLPRVFAAWQVWADPQALDRRLVPILTLPAERAGYLSVLGEFVGPFAELDALIQPLVRAAKPTQMIIKHETYIEAVHRFTGGGGSGASGTVAGGVIGPTPAVRAGSGGAAGAFAALGRAGRAASPARAARDWRRWVVDGSPDPVLDRFKNTSAFVCAPLPPAAVATLVAQLRRAPSPNALVQFNLHGGAEARLANDATAYPWRQGVRYSMQYQAYWSEPAEGPALSRWVAGFRQAMRPWTRGAYVNYIDSEIVDWPTAYYAGNVRRLVAVKRRYDPGNLFDFPQGIGRIRL